MAIKLNYDLSGDIYTDAYLKVQKIVLGERMNEQYVNQDDDTVVLTYQKEPETLAHIFVYPDQEARENNARPIHMFGIEFDYDINSGDNIYQVAYQALKAVERFQNVTIEDV
jgi:hypothetical protein